ncbi:MAG TPA: hypothetical protein PK771_12890 [Spirochaetota bacterium]|nr:hypothetical protein [Spirochaetota bacterium]
MGSTTTYKSSEGTYTVSAGTVELSGVPGLLSMKYNAELKDGVLFLRDPNNYDATASLYSFKKK